MTKERESREAKRAREVQADADKIEAELTGLLTGAIKQFKALHPGQMGYMYLEGMTVVVDTEKPEDEDRIIHVVS